MREKKEHIRDMVTICHLWNLRTRIVGYNELKTTYWTHIDDNWAEQLRCGSLEEYMKIAKKRLQEYDRDFEGEF